MRLIGLGVCWAVFTGVWHLAINLGGAIPGGGATAAGGAAATGGLFAMLRNWIADTPRRPKESALDVSRPILPMILAYATIALAAAGVALLLILGGDDWFRWWLTADALCVPIAVALFIDPGEFGLHAFYRERIARAYLGAHRPPEAEMNRGTDATASDDIALTDLKARPHHLVCCAANDLNGDTLPSLARGSRSAVLSRHFFAMGRRAGLAVPHLKLGAAITASAAAFNSNMGSISMDVGPAVAFLMTSLNLRLGLWVRRPGDVLISRGWPGLLLYREMFGLTEASEQSRGSTDLHLSDGAHFENLALYELVRRHCRYIIVSDVGADPEVAFDDLGNALRRIREDFGVEITLDARPLRPNEDGLAKQHAVVGSIHYSPTDRGILIYIKPALTGDEPPDVRQYHRRNTAFPHETTGDQFYDEAQWESYLRLGLHTAEEVFDFVRAPAQANEKPETADWIFATASYRWTETPPELLERHLEMSRRVAAFHLESQQQGPVELFEELFPELEFVVDPRPHGNGPRPPIDARALGCLLRMTQLMEDIWRACELDEWWSHPINIGWVNVLSRWATAPSFRFWWPVLRPMFSSEFRDFIHDRFPVPALPAGATPAVYDPAAGKVELMVAGVAAGLTELGVTHLSCRVGTAEI